MSEVLRKAVTAHFEHARGASVGHVEFAAQPAVSPDGTRVACTAATIVAVERDPERAVRVLDLATGELGPPVDDGASSAPAWSPDGTRLAWVAERAGGAVARWAAVPGGRPVDVPVPGGATVEAVVWSPDGTRLLLSVAEPGAEISDVLGSGTIPTDGAAPSWYPVVLDGPVGGGWRRLQVAPCDGSPARPLSRPGQNVWEAVWAGADVLATVSTGPSESDWYSATLVRIDPAGRTTTIGGVDAQVCLPAAAPSGGWCSAVVGTMSDRGLHSGSLALLAPGSTTLEVADTAGVDVSGTVWTDERTVVYTGLRGLRTVVGRLDAVTGTVTELWDSELTCGDLVPEVAAAADVVVVCRHGYTTPPALVRLAADGEHIVADLAHPGTADVPGTIEGLDWRSPDGTRVEGLLVTPPGAGPHPLVVHVHGGPVAAWRNSWSMRYPYTPLLAAQGYAVLHPNMRGSTGRGQRFVRDGLRDMGGVDATDVLAGVEALATAGRVDPHRVAVTGNSYGGYLSAWLVATTDRFAAAIARSPVTDWVSQHHASNLPGFDAICLDGDPLAPDSPYRTRSPLYRAADVVTPVLLMAGARDLATPPEQAAMFHRALVERGRDSTLVIYPEEGHGVRHHDALVDQCVRMLAFLQRTLQTTEDKERTECTSAARSSRAAGQRPMPRWIGAGTTRPSSGNGPAGATTGPATSGT